MRPGSSGCGEEDDPAAVGGAGAIAIEQRCQLRVGVGHGGFFAAVGGATLAQAGTILRPAAANLPNRMFDAGGQPLASLDARQVQIIISDDRGVPLDAVLGRRSEEHTSELQSLMRISYAVFCLKKKSI